MSNDLTLSQPNKIIYFLEDENGLPIIDDSTGEFMAVSADIGKD